MRLTPTQVEQIKQAAEQTFGPDARVWLFGSRVDDSKRGGDVDLMIETDQVVENHALTAARMAAKVSRNMHGRRVDVIIQAPGIPNQPIHQAARRQGVQL